MVVHRALGGIAQDIADAIVDGIFVLLNGIVTAILWVELWAIQGLVLYTPAIWTPWFETDYVRTIPGITGPGDDTVIGGFYLQVMEYLGILVGIGVLLSAFIMIGGVLPRWQQAAKENLGRVLLFALMAIVAPKIFQLALDINGLLMYIAFDHPDQYTDLLNELWPALVQDFGSGATSSRFGLFVGLIIAVVSVLFLLLELVLRYGFILGIGALSPIVMIAYSFNFSRGFAEKATQVFLGWTFFGFITAVIIRISLQTIVAMSANAGGANAWLQSVPTWALLSGFFLAMAAMPKLLTNVTDSAKAASKHAQAGVMAAAAGTAIATGGLSMAASGATRSAGRAGAAAASRAAATTDSVARSRFYTRSANLGRRVHDVGSKGTEKSATLMRSAGRQIKAQTKQAVGLGGMTRHGYDDISARAGAVPVYNPGNGPRGPGPSGRPPGTGQGAGRSDANGPGEPGGGERQRLGAAAEPGPRQGAGSIAQRPEDPSDPDEERVKETLGLGQTYEEEQERQQQKAAERRSRDQYYRKQQPRFDDPRDAHHFKQAFERKQAKLAKREDAARSRQGEATRAEQREGDAHRHGTSGKSHASSDGDESAAASKEQDSGQPPMDPTQSQRRASRRRRRP